MSYWWSRVEAPSIEVPFTMLIRAEDFESARKIAITEFLPAQDPQAADQHEACQSCPLFEECYATAWHGAVGDKHEQGQTLTLVHVCPCCLNTCLSTRQAQPDPRVVPDACQRRNPQFDAIVCDACSHERAELYKLHPRYESLMKASEKFAEAFGESEEEENPLIDPSQNANVINFATKHKQVEAERELNKAQQPFSYITSAEQFDRARGILAMWFMHDYWSCLPDDLRAYFAEFPAEVAAAKREWLEELYLSLGRHLKKSDAECAEAVTREWVLGFTDQNDLSMGWMAVPVEDRKKIVRDWKVIAEKRVGAELYEMDPETTNALFNGE